MRIAGFENPIVAAARSLFAVNWANRCRLGGAAGLVVGRSNPLGP